MKHMKSLALVLLAALLVDSEYRASRWRGMALDWGKAYTNSAATTERWIKLTEEVERNRNLTIREFSERFPKFTQANLLAVSGAFESGQDKEMAEYLLPFIVKLRDRLTNTVEQ